MHDALRVTRYSLRDAWDEFAVLVALNVVWSATALLPFLPLLFMTSPLAAILGGLLLGLPVPVVSGALGYVTNQVTRGKVATWSLFADGIRHYWTKSLAVAAANLLVAGVLFSNLRFYELVVPDPWATVVRSILIVAAVYWGLMQIYWFPMILELESEKVLEALRRAAALVIISPVFSLSVAILAVVLAALCILSLVPAVVLMASLLLLVSNHATRSRLATVQKKPYQPGEIEEA